MAVKIYNINDVVPEGKEFIYLEGFGSDSKDIFHDPTTCDTRLKVYRGKTYNDEATLIFSKNSIGGGSLGIDGKTYSYNIKFSLNETELNTIRNTCKEDKEVTIIIQYFPTGSIWGYITCSEYHMKFADAEPTLPETNISLQEINEQIKTFTKGEMFIQGLSKIQVDIQPLQCKKNAYPKKYNCKIGSVEKSVELTEETSQSPVRFIIENFGEPDTTALTVTAEDSRGFSITTVKNITISEYGIPYIGRTTSGRLDFERCNADGSKNVKGVNLRVSFNAYYSALLNNSNSCHVHLTIYNKQNIVLDIPEYASEMPTPRMAQDFIMYDQIVKKDGIPLQLDKTKAYKVKLVITDDIGYESSILAYINSGKVCLHLGNDGNSAAFGGYSQEANILDINDWDLKFKKLYLSQELSKITEKINKYDEKINNNKPIENTSGNFKWIEFTNGSVFMIMEESVTGTASSTTSFAPLNSINYPVKFIEKPIEIASAVATNLLKPISIILKNGNSITQTGTYSSVANELGSQQTTIRYSLIIIGKIFKEA